METHYATIWESIADEIPDEVALVHGLSRRTWAEYDARAARLAAAYTAAGLGHDSKVALFLYNGNEYLEAQYGAFKMRGVPVNVNYRYLDEELWYLLDNADAEALVFHSSLGDRVSRVIDRLPKLRLLIEVDDGASGQVDRAKGYEEVIAAHEPMERVERSEDDIYMLYTGGTTGMPKGVMYRIGDHTSLFLSLGYSAVGLTPPADPSEVPGLVRQITDAGTRMISVPTAPLMHGTGLWLGCFVAHLAGGAVVTLAGRSLDGHEVLRTAQDNRAVLLVLVGDAMTKPLIKAFDEASERGEPYDLSPLKMIISSGVMWTTEVKEQLLDRVPQLTLIDAIGSTEGSIGSQVTMRGVATETARFDRNPTTQVITEDGRHVKPGSDEIGMIAAGGFVPIGYFKDPEKSARTFRVIEGIRYVFAGDYAKVAADGTLILLGRGNQVINSGGEKVFPEEVEEATKRVEGVIDCLVVGIDDERFGQAVTAVVALAPGADVDEATIIGGVKDQLAGFKAPRRVVFVAQIPRAPNGKADYKTALQYANDAAGLS